MSTETNGNGSGAKAFGGIMAVICVLGVTIGAIVSVTKPMIQRIDQIERQLGSLDAGMRIDDMRERKDAENIAILTAGKQAAEARLTQFDITLQQEIRAAAAIVNEKVLALDTKLQIEIAAAQKQLDTRIDSNDRFTLEAIRHLRELLETSDAEGL